MRMKKYFADIIHVNDISEPELEIYSAMSENQLKHIYEPKEGVFIAESPNVIMRALDAGYLPESVLVETRQIEGEAKEVLARISEIVDSQAYYDKGKADKRHGDFEAEKQSDGFKIYTAEAEILKDITGFYMVRGMLAVMRRKKLSSVEEVCKNAGRIAVLEDIVNPTNVGAIIRSAAALGIDGVLLTPACSDPLYRRAARVSMGTVFQIPWTFFLQEPSVKDEQSYIRKLKELGFQIAAMALEENSIPIDSVRLKQAERLAIVIGTEGEGLRKETIADSDFTVKIPMYHQVDSLNAAAASAVAFWELAGKG